jgi:hypothetical protein
VFCLVIIVRLAEVKPCTWSTLSTSERKWEGKRDREKGREGDDAVDERRKERREGREK